jgi:uncharacterized membrane protein YagU involved in acid resistance
VEFVMRGVAAGFAGTTVMSAAMLALKRAGMEPGELEPKEVAENVEEAIGVRSLLSRRAFEASWIMLHFGYGSTSGVAYAVARGILRLDRPALVGTSFGMFLWAMGYCGWLPLLGLYPPPTRVPKRKVAANILAHVTYGTTTAMSYRLLRSEP